MRQEITNKLYMEYMTKQKTGKVNVTAAHFLSAKTKKILIWFHFVK